MWLKCFDKYDFVCLQHLFCRSFCQTQLKFAILKNGASKFENGHCICHLYISFLSSSLAGKRDIVVTILFSVCACVRAS